MGRARPTACAGAPLLEERALADLGAYAWFDVDALPRAPLGAGAIPQLTGSRAAPHVVIGSGARRSRAPGRRGSARSRGSSGAIYTRARRWARLSRAPSGVATR